MMINCPPRRTRSAEYPAQAPISAYAELQKYFEAYLKAYDESVILKKG